MSSGGRAGAQPKARRASLRGKGGDKAPVAVKQEPKALGQASGDAHLARELSPPLPTLRESGEPLLGHEAEFLPSSPTHGGGEYDPATAQPVLLKRDDVEEPAGLAAVAEIAALECALAEKERRAKARAAVAAAAAGGADKGGGGGAGKAAGAGAGAPTRLLPLKRTSEDVAIGQPLDGHAPAAAAAVLAHHHSPAVVCGAPLGHPATAVALSAAAPVAVGVPLQQAEALRQQQLQLQATILAQAQGQEEVATSAVEAGASTNLRDDEDGSGESGAGDGPNSKKQRLVWTTELHNRFINAITHLGLKHAVPKNILTMMNVEGMTRENVASHLQKYRMYLKKIGGYSDKDKVDPDALQAIHEQNVQQMAAQQALQQSLAAMHGGYGYYALPGGVAPGSPTSAAAGIPSAPACAGGAVVGAPVGGPPQPMPGNPMQQAYPMFAPPQQPPGSWPQFPGAQPGFPPPGFPGPQYGMPPNPYGPGGPAFGGPQQPQHQQQAGAGGGIPSSAPPAGMARGADPNNFGDQQAAAWGAPGQPPPQYPPFAPPGSQRPGGGGIGGDGSDGNNKGGLAGGHDFLPEHP